MAWPPAEDLRVRPKPQPPEAVLWSREAGEKHDNAIEADGDASRAQIGRLCRFFAARGMPLPFACPPAPEGRTD